jgi:rfaE bifunctional protein nucleotidyltransferase chain/domain
MSEATITAYSNKVRTRDELKSIIAQEKDAGKTVVFANGCFDLLHGGHISYLESSRSVGDLLVVGLNSDSSMRTLKGPGRPIYNEQWRAELLAAMESVDYIVIFDEPTCDGLLETLRPSIHAKGTDYTEETVPERETAVRCGIKTYIAGAPKENSTKDIIKVILAKHS